MAASGVFVYKVGIVYASACAPIELPVLEVERAVNAAAGPTGVGLWKLDSEGVFRTGELNPCPCNDEPGARLHYLLSC